MHISREIMRFFDKQHIVLVSTLNAEGKIHCAVKGLAVVKEDGRLFIVDLYFHNTFKNLENNPCMSITAIDEHAFAGYTLQGTGAIIPREQVQADILQACEKRTTRRISERIIAGLSKGLRSKQHHEAELPNLKYVIEMTVDTIIDLAPPSREKGKK